MEVSNSLRFLVGTYTDSLSKGIESISLDTATGQLSSHSTLLNTSNPSYLHLTKNGLYSFNEVEEVEGAQLIFLTKQQTHYIDINGDYPCHLDSDSSESLLAVANYGSGNVSVYQLDSEGKPLNLIANLFNEGCGPNLQRQTSPHAHQVKFLRQSSELWVVDLGADRVYIYGYADSQFELCQSIELPAGAGPRHLVLNKNEDIAYIVCELSETLVTLTKQANEWCIEHECDLLNDSEKGEAAAAIKLSSCEQFLYVSCRHQNRIVLFDVKSGQPERIHDIDCGGAFPRDFTISSDGKWLIVANQHSNNIVSFQRDEQSGMFKPTGFEIEIGSPVCILESNTKDTQAV